MNPQWKGGQLGCPNGSDQKLSYLILELLSDLVTPILECADM